jgi:hypothetical protein
MCMWLCDCAQAWWGAVHGLSGVPVCNYESIEFQRALTALAAKLYALAFPSNSAPAASAAAPPAPPVQVDMKMFATAAPPSPTQPQGVARPVKPAAAAPIKKLPKKQ